MIDKLIAKLRSHDQIQIAECKALASAFSEPVVVHRHHELVRAGKEPHSTTILLSGFAHRVEDMGDGRRQSIELYVPGDFVDLDSYVLKRNEHDVYCLSTCNVASVSHVRLSELTSEFPRLTWLLWLNSAVNAALYRERIMSLGARNAMERLAQFVCETAMRLRVVGLGDERGFDLPLTQRDLAEMLGLSIVHLNRTIRDLREHGLAKIARRHVLIADWDRLKALAQFDDRYLNLGETVPRDVRLVATPNVERPSDDRRQHQARPARLFPDIAERRLRGGVLDLGASRHAGRA